MNITQNGTFTCIDFRVFTDWFILSSISFVGIVLNLTCVLIFSKKKLLLTSKENAMYKYLLVKSICDIFVLLECLTKLLVQCKTCSFSRTYFICILSLLTEDYFKQVFRLLWKRNVRNLDN